MIDRIIAFSIRRRALVIAAAVALAIWGAFAASRTPVDAIPDLSENQVIVYAEWPGHSPREVEDQVTYPLSIDLQGLRGVRVVRSSSDFHSAFIAVIFEDSVDFATARRRVAERLARTDAAFPPGVAPRLAPDSLATGQIFWYTVEGPGHDPGRLRAIQDWYVRHQLASVPGVAEVASVGGAPIEFQVSIDPNRLRDHRVTLGAVIDAVARSNGSAGGNVVHKGNAEYIVRSVGWLGASPDDSGRFEPDRVLRDLEQVTVSTLDGDSVRLDAVAGVAVGPQPRRGVLEKDGVEVTGGVVLMAHGENPLEVTRRIRDKLRELQAGLPEGVRLVPFYDRTPLIRGAISTVAGTLAEAILTATACVVVVLLHLRTSFIIAITLPLAVLTSFALMWALRALGIADIQTNLMSLAGITISVGVLVDSSIVMAENAMHALKERFGDRPVRGDVRGVVLPACLAVGRPIFFSVVIMLLSFLPVFALGGMEGKMFRPLAITKSFALLAAAVLAITLVPALCTLFIKGRLRSETESWLVRSVIEVYRPVLGHLLDRPSPLLWVLGVTFVVGLAPIGSRPLSLTALLVALSAVGLTARTRAGRVAATGSLVIVALVADRSIEPLGREFMTPLDEGMVMDMPITIPRASVTQSADDLKARDMVLCRFPEVAMVVGKAGRAETPTDPAPLDMIETMVDFRPRDSWPKRKLLSRDALRQADDVIEGLIARGVIRSPESAEARASLRDEVAAEALPRFDALMREFAYHRHQEYRRGAGLDPAVAAIAGQEAGSRARWAEHVRRLDGELLERGASAFTRLAMEEALGRAEVADARVAAYLSELRRLRDEPTPSHHGGPGHAMSRTAIPPPTLEPQPILDAIQGEFTRRFARRLLLWRKDRADLIGFGGELDRAVSMPGWTNVWTMPIQNRVDMLATGVNTMVGIRVLGRGLDEVVRASEAIAAVVKRIPGAADVVSDPIRGKGYLEVRVDRSRAARHGVGVGDVNDAVEIALAGRVATTTVQGRERHPVRVRYGRDWRTDEQSVADLLVPARPPGRPGLVRQVPLSEVADIRVVEGPATIKAENGLLRNYVRLNVRGRGISDFVDEARRIVAGVRLPEGTYVEWTGQFEHEARARGALQVIVPVVAAIIFLVLYATYGDLADAALMMLAVPGVIAGGVYFQWLFGYKFSVTVWVGYIACFGMATSTGIIMLVYLRESVAKAGGLANLSPEGLRLAVISGAANRLRPKLLTEGTTLLGLAPMLWADGVGAEVIKPMAAPVLGGLLVADEVIDLFLPILFFHVRRLRWERLHRARVDAGAGASTGPRSTRLDGPRIEAGDASGLDTYP